MKCLTADKVKSVLPLSSDDNGFSTADCCVPEVVGNSGKLSSDKIPESWFRISGEHLSDPDPSLLEHWLAGLDTAHIPESLAFCLRYQGLCAAGTSETARLKVNLTCDEKRLELIKHVHADVNKLLRRQNANDCTFIGVVFHEVFIKFVGTCICKHSCTSNDWRS
jgi:hypothetical protein